MSQATALTNLCRAAGATFTEVAGHTVPASFGNPENEYRQALSGAVLFDRSPAGKILVSGKDAPSFLHNLCTNDINNLPLGGGCEAYFCDSRAKALAQAFVYHILSEGRHAFWLDVTPGFNEKVLKHLDRHLISEAVELVDETERFAQIHLAGPQAKRVLEQALGNAVPELAEFQHMERNIGTTTCHIRRHDPLGVPGYEVICLNEGAEQVWRLLQSTAAAPAWELAFETLRVMEAGTPVYGIDIGENASSWK